MRLFAYCTNPLIMSSSSAGVTHEDPQARDTNPFLKSGLAAVASCGRSPAFPEEKHLHFYAVSHSFVIKKLQISRNATIPNSVTSKTAFRGILPPISIPVQLAE